MYIYCVPLPKQEIQYLVLGEINDSIIIYNVIFLFAYVIKL